MVIQPNGSFQPDALLEHNGEKALVVRVQLWSEDIKEQAVLVTTRKVSQLRALVAGGSGIDGIEPGSGNGLRGGKAERTDRSLGVTDALESETHLIARSGDATETCTHCNLARSILVGAECGQETKARATLLDSSLTIVDNQSVTVGDMKGIAGASVNPELGFVGRYPIQHLYDSRQRAALSRVEKLTHPITRQGTTCSNTMIWEKKEREIGAIDLQVVVNQSVNAVQDEWSGGRSGRQSDRGFFFG
jgi:hypothetical protein